MASIQRKNLEGKCDGPHVDYERMSLVEIQPEYLGH